MREREKDVRLIFIIIFGGEFYIYLTGVFTFKNSHSNESWLCMTKCFHHFLHDIFLTSLFAHQDCDISAHCSRLFLEPPLSTNASKN
jgi:hypothetical protein